MDDINIRLILSYENNLAPNLSTSQMVMVGLALCKPDMLWSAGYSHSPRAAWNRLDDEQRSAIINFRNHFNTSFITD